VSWVENCAGVIRVAECEIKEPLDGALPNFKIPLHCGILKNTSNWGCAIVLNRVSCSLKEKRN